MSPTPITTVLFDFDDTLAPSLSRWAHAFQVVFADLGVVLDDEGATRCLHRGWEEVAADHGVCTAEELRVRLYAQLPASYLDVELFPDATHVLDECRSDGLAVALVTSSPRELILGVTERLGVLGHFDALVCGDDVERLKPDPEPLLRALDALGRPPAEALMVGDSPVDVLAGRAAGTRTAVLVPPTVTERRRDRLRALGADHELTHLREVLAVLRG